MGWDNNKITSFKSEVKVTFISYALVDTNSIRPPTYTHNRIRKERTFTVTGNWPNKFWCLLNEPTVFQPLETWHSRERLTSAPVLFLGLTRPSSLLWFSYVTNIWLRSCDSLLSWIYTDAVTQYSLGNVWSNVVLPLILLANAFYWNGLSAGTRV